MCQRREQKRSYLDQCRSCTVKMTASLGVSSQLYFRTRKPNPESLHCTQNDKQCSNGDRQVFHNVYHTYISVISAFCEKVCHASVGFVDEVAWWNHNARYQDLHGNESIWFCLFIHKNTIKLLRVSQLNDFDGANFISFKTRCKLSQVVANR